ncbi:transposase family protein [Streptomyces malaysiensis]|uniref:transposase family protein n=1 Tax=Streptomyces malaysiensis TaxID=92644 RepID=UPI001F210C72|nr:transposase family protein [Streptomyces autolyticus]
MPTVRRTRRANRPNYSGKQRRHDQHFLALTDENGRLIWISAAPPGRTHDIAAARRDHILTHLRAAGLGALADLGFLDLAHGGDDPVIVIGYKATLARKLTPGEKEANRILAAAHAPIEHGCAHLKSWRILTVGWAGCRRGTRPTAGSRLRTTRMPSDAYAGRRTVVSQSCSASYRCSCGRP